MAVSISLSSEPLGTNPLIPSQTKSLTVVPEPSNNMVDSALVRVPTLLIEIDASLLTIAAILPLLIPVVIIPLSVVIADATVGHVGLAVSLVIVRSLT